MTSNRWNGTKESPVPKQQEEVTEIKRAFCPKGMVRVYEVKGEKLLRVVIPNHPAPVIKHVERGRLKRVLQQEGVWDV